MFPTSRISGLPRTCNESEHIKRVIKRWSIRCKADIRSDENLELFAAEAQRSALNNVFNKQSWLAAIGGTAIGAVTLYVLQLAPPPNALLSFPLSGVAAVSCYRFALRQGVNMTAGALLGLETGILMSLLVCNLDHYRYGR